MLSIEEEIHADHCRSTIGNRKTQIEKRETKFFSRVLRADGGVEIETHYIINNMAREQILMIDVNLSHIDELILVFKVNRENVNAMINNKWLYQTC